MTIRIYQNLPLKLHDTIQLDEKASHHLMVLRISMASEINIFNGNGVEYTAKIIEFRKKNMILQLMRKIEMAPESPLELCLVQSLVRGDRMDFAIQKAVELGVKQIYPIETERSNFKLNQPKKQKRLAHWQGIIISALEQSGRQFMPILHEPSSLDEFIQQVSPQQGLIFHLTGDAKTKLIFDKSKPFYILIGPEGGFTENELALCKKNGLQCSQLGPRVLRTETAGMAALAILQSQFGDIQLPVM